MGYLLQPALVAASISVLFGLVGLWLNLRTTKVLHLQRLATDVALAEKRTAAEIDLAKQRFTLDRSLAAWRRRVELAEDVLADFYKARDIIDAARSPAAFGNEGATRKKAEWEGEDDTNMLNAYYVAVERLDRESNFFSGLFARRYRFIALFGNDAGEAFEELAHIRHKIIGAVRMLLGTYRHRNSGSSDPNGEQWEQTI